MFQGTGSTVGKSMMATALCRIFKDDGYKVVPFKSQNMALNSFVTVNGKEMGRAQVVQAEAAGITPTVHMNPILLKPTSDVGSQIVVNGEVFKNLSASEYYKYKQELMNEVMKSYAYLDQAYEVIVIEGAGSPAEINLRKNDIVNMGLAEAVDSPVILIGDIDKGGVFAAIYGTYMLLSQEEQQRIKGYIINKFRGDIQLLQPGIDMLYERLPLPCLGVVPYGDIQIDDEDSVTDRLTQKKDKPIQIGVVRLVHLSNFTDFTALELEEDVAVRYIQTSKEFHDVDMVILPGSKSTIKDLEDLKEKKLDQAILQAHQAGKLIMGICGGHQMLGGLIKDPDHVETQAESCEGLGLLDMVTYMAKIKTTVQSEGVIIRNPKGVEGEKLTVKGYEIHMGKTQLGNSVTPFIRLSTGSLDGAITTDGRVFGTYLHGIFDYTEFRHNLLNKLRRDKSMAEQGQVDYKALKEKAYDDLATLVRTHLDIDRIKDIAGL